MEGRRETRVTNVLELIEQVRQVGTYPVKWDVCDESIYKQVDALATKATGDLRAFVSREYTGSGGPATRLHAYAEGVPLQATLLANSAWEGCGGRENPERARLILAAARAEFSRSELVQTLWLVDTISVDEIQSGKTSAELLKDVTHRDWFDADATARRPVASIFHEGAAGRFMDWLSYYDEGRSANCFENNHPACDVEPRVTDAEMLHGMALTWIDEAVVAMPHCLALMAEAAAAMCMGGFDAGLRYSDSYNKQRATLAGSKGGVARHRQTAALKAWALQQAANMKGSERTIARTLTRQIPSHFASVSSDPVRLIYDALRDARKGRVSQD
jgi:hypothetical protein